MKRLDRAAALATAAGLALCALLAFVYNGALDSPEVEIVVNGEVVERLSLAGEPRDITVRAGGGKFLAPARAPSACRTSSSSA